MVKSHFLQFVACPNSRGISNQKQVIMKLNHSILFFLLLFLNKNINFK